MCCLHGWEVGRRLGAQDDLGRIIRDKNATARALASGSGSGNFHALPLGVRWTILGTLISAACAGFAGRLRGRVVTMVMVGGRSYIWPGPSIGNPSCGWAKRTVAVHARELGRHQVTQPGRAL